MNELDGWKAGVPKQEHPIKSDKDLERNRMVLIRINKGRGRWVYLSSRLALSSSAAKSSPSAWVPLLAVLNNVPERFEERVLLAGLTREHRGRLIAHVNANGGNEQNAAPPYVYIYIANRHQIKVIADLFPAPTSDASLRPEGDVRAVEK